MAALVYNLSWEIDKEDDCVESPKPPSSFPDQLSRVVKSSELLDFCPSPL